MKWELGRPVTSALKTVEAGWAKTGLKCDGDIELDQKQQVSHLNLMYIRHFIYMVCVCDRMLWNGIRRMYLPRMRTHLLSHHCNPTVATLRVFAATILSDGVTSPN